MQRPSSSSVRKPLGPERAFEAAVALHQQGKPTEAERFYRAVLQVDHAHFGSLHNLGLICRQKGNLNEAVALLLKALRTNPNSPEVHFNLANSLQALNRHEEAIAHYSMTLADAHCSAQAHNYLGNSLQALDRHAEAIAHYVKALAIEPGYAGAHYNLGSALRALDRHAEAIAHYEKAIAIRPDFAEAHNDLANALALLKRPEAIRHYEQAVALRPDLAEAHNNLGMELESLGCLDVARGAIEKAIELEPRRASFYRNLVGLKRFASGDRHLASMEALARDMPSLSRAEQIDLHFALGKALADIREHERSFHHVLDGNALKRGQIAYDEASTLGLFDRIRSVFTPELMRAKKGLGVLSPVPVFILGMPRSGSTLVEQILASHPKVFGAGEIMNLREAIEGLDRPTGSLTPFPEAVASFTGDEFRKLGARYLGMMTSGAPAVERITDKLPDNFLLAGLIHLALPNARIIHTRRDPIDTCFSYFSKMFTGEKPYTNDLGELGRYYRAYATLMEHWRSVLPEGVMLEVQYEEVVADLEPQARRMLTHCGLDWDDSCLAFHQTQRPVRTGSSAQVRQPIYSTAIGRWRPYKEMLGPLLEALGAG
jgi:tetratricopeptide (TPR) repeat protein